MLSWMKNFSIGSKHLTLVVQHCVVSSSWISRVTVLAGYFDVFVPSEYLISSLPGSRFLGNQDIVIRKYISGGEQIAFLVGLL